MKNTKCYPIPGFRSLYVINDIGIIKAIERTIYDSLGRRRSYKERVIKTRIDVRSGYLVVRLTNSEGKHTTQYVHRLVALAFIPNPLNKSLVNHLNGIKTDHSLCNLEWCTASENTLHAIKNNLCNIPSMNRIAVVDVCTGIYYPSIKKASIAIKMNYYDCINMLNGRLLNTSCLRKVTIMTSQQAA